jgi:hypothetical protein
MAGRLQENLNSMGVVVSILFTFFSFYYEHIKSSESVDASLSNHLVQTNDVSKKVESMTVDLLLLNKGDSSVTVSDLWFEIDMGAPTCCARVAGLKTSEDALIVPILLPSMQASKITVRFKVTGIPSAPWGLSVRSKDDLPSEPLPPPPPPINVEKMSIVPILRAKFRQLIQ